MSDLRDGDLAEAHHGTLVLGIRHVLCREIDGDFFQYIDLADNGAALVPGVSRPPLAAPPILRVGSSSLDEA